MFNKFFEKRMILVKNYFKWYDISLIKIGSMIFALLLAKYFNILLQANWYWYVLLLIIIYIRFIYLINVSKNKHL